MVYAPIHCGRQSTVDVADGLGEHTFVGMSCYGSVDSAAHPRRLRDAEVRRLVPPGVEMLVLLDDTRSGFVLVVIEIAYDVAALRVVGAASGWLRRRARC